MVFEEDINLRKDTKSPSNISRSSIYECNEPGTFYLSRAVNGLISGVDVSFSRDSNGNIYDVNSFATGLVVGWSWLQSSVLYNPNHYFCIQSLTTYGISAANITLGYTALVRITVQIKGCDVTTVNSAYGHC